LLAPISPSTKSSQKGADTVSPTSRPQQQTDKKSPIPLLLPFGKDLLKRLKELDKEIAEEEEKEEQMLRERMEKEKMTAAGKTRSLSALLPPPKHPTKRPADRPPLAPPLSLKKQKIDTEQEPDLGIEQK
jgi:hypothetical protein